MPVRWPKMAPRLAQVGPDMGQDRAKIAQDGLKRASRCSEMGQDKAKIDQDGPKRASRRSKRAEMGSKGLIISSLFSSLIASPILSLILYHILYPI